MNLDIKADKKQAGNLLLSMALMKLNSKERKTLLQRMGRYTAAYARKLQKTQRTNHGQTMHRKGDLSSHKKAKIVKLFPNLFKSKNLLITDPRDGSMKLYFRKEGKNIAIDKDPASLNFEKSVKKVMTGHIGNIAHFHHHGGDTAYRKWNYPNQFQRQKYADLYRRIQGPKRAKIESAKNIKLCTVQQAILIARMGVYKGISDPRKILYELPWAYDKWLIKDNLDKFQKVKMSNRMTARPILGLDDARITELADFVITHLKDRYTKHKVELPGLNLFGE